MEYPKISIVTPVFNQVNFIKETIQSILSQGYPNLEYIIIDGGSTDGTVDIIKKYESQLAYWVSEPDNGMYDALQKGFDHSTGEIMGWLNADDLYFNGCLRLISELFSAHTDINWVTGTSHTLDTDGVFTGNAPAKKFCKYQFLMGDYKWIAQESTLWRRSLWDQCGGMIDTHLHFAGDFELWLRFIQKDTLYYLGFPVGIFRKRENQLSQQETAYADEVKRIYDTLQISKRDQNIIQKYRRRKRLANRINKIGYLDGKRISGLKAFEEKYFRVANTIAYSSDDRAFIFSDER